MLYVPPNLRKNKEDGDKEENQNRKYNRRNLIVQTIEQKVNITKEKIYETKKQKEIGMAIVNLSNTKIMDYKRIKNSWSANETKKTWSLIEVGRRIIATMKNRVKKKLSRMIKITTMKDLLIKQNITH